MRRLKLNKILVLGLILTIAASCERDLTDEAVLATFPDIADVYTDNPVNLTDQFFISFDPAEGANPDGFGTDDDEAYAGESSIRIEVPNPSDPAGNFIGGIFVDRGVGRNLTRYDALTFWAKGSTTATDVQFGFGTDFIFDKYAVSQSNVLLSTDWRKYIIPIPDPSKLTQELGMFLFAAGTNSTGGAGYTIWIDEIRFEDLGSIGQPRPKIFNGATMSETAFNGSTIQITGTAYTANLPSGTDVTVGAAPSYFSFFTSDSEVATVSETGEINVIGAGTATITAAIDGVLAEGALEITSIGDFPTAPIPMQPAANVLSIFSDAYDPVVNANFTPGFGGSTTVTTISSAGGDEFATYTNNNFTGIMFDDSPIDGTAMSFLHVDIYVDDASTSVEFQIRDIGANQTIETNIFTGFPDGDDVDFRFTAAGLTAGAWNSFDIPLAGDLTAQRNNLGAIILAGGPNFILDNIYFYTN